MHVVHSLETGGMERGLVSLIQRTHLKRMQHTVCTMRDAGPLADELPSSVDVVSFSFSGRRRTSSIRLASLIRRVRPDIVHARNFNTWSDCVIASKLAGRRSTHTVLAFHGLEAAGGFTPQQKRRSRLLGFAKHPFTAVSRSGCDQLVEELNVPRERISVLDSGVDTRRFFPPDDSRRLAARQSLGIGRDELVLVMVASLVPVKDHAGAFRGIAEAASRVGGCRLLVVGGGPLEETLRTQADRLPHSTRVSFLGQTADVTVPLHAADIFVLFSSSEQTSHALLEAIACGMPIITTDVGDSASIIAGDRCGLVVPAGDTAALGHAVVRLGSDARLRRRCGLAARRRATEHFGVDAAVDGYCRYYQSIVQCESREHAACAALPASYQIAR